MPLIECIPNFSEGRRRHVIDAIVKALISVPVHLLDVSSDHDHNRTVVTLAGEPETILESAFRGIQTAAQHINLDEHEGVHPRIGAADVVPFVPLRQISISDCVQWAHQLGQRVAGELDLPVYYYEYAALRPERANLADVRRGGYEMLKTTIETAPQRAPDAGAARLGSAGAVAIGVRGPLVAYNVYLDTDDVAVARTIARRIRTSGGGLPALKAMGVLVNGLAQVSMNVVDLQQTSLYTIMEFIRTEAEKHQVQISHSEIVGLIPQSALVETALEYLQLPSEAGAQTLEKRLSALTGDYRPLEFE